MYVQTQHQCHVQHTTKSPFRHLSARLPRRESLAVAIQYPQALWPVSSLSLSSRAQACPFRCAIPGKSPPKLSLSLPLFISPPPLESKCKCISTVYPSSRSPVAQKNGADVPKNGCDPGPGCWCRFRTMADQLRDWECGKRVKALGFPCFEGEAT